MREYTKEFYQWLKENKYMQYKLLPVDPEYLRIYFAPEEIDVDRNIEDIMWWDLGRLQKFEEMTLGDQILYINESMEKLWGEYLNEKTSSFE